MTWHKLNNSELQACRKLLMLDVSEAAELIGKVSNRTWQYWESGRSQVPADVDEVIYASIQRRNDLVTEYTQWQLDNNSALLTMSYYHTFDLYVADHPGTSKLDWRIHQSAVSFVFSEGGEVELINS
jgi:hypothetical protein